MRRRCLPGETEPPSKGELKRQAQDVQDLAARLIAAPDSLLDGLDLPDTLRDAVLLARRISSRPALLRQTQYVAKLMRNLPLDQIRQGLEAGDAVRRDEARRFHEIELWRDSLVREGEAALERLLERYPELDAEPLRGLLDHARQELDPHLARRARRNLFRALGELLPPA
jgi:ribosome-associated protein